MKSFHWLFAVVVVAPQVIAGDMGLYDLLDESHPKPFLDAVGRVTISSQSNDNSRYYLALQAASAFSLPCAQIGLVVGDKTIRFNSQGQDKGGRYTSMETQIESRELIPRIAQHFNTKVTDRRHPGHRMLVTFLPEKEEFRPAGPVIVKLRITNIGGAAFAYIQGGRQRGPRDNQFAFSAELVGKTMVADTGDPRNMGGMGFRVTLEPGRSHEITVDLARWFKFQEAGTYLIRGSYHMNFTDPEAHDLYTIWEDYACADFTLTMGS